MFNVRITDITNTCLLPGFDVKRWLWYLPHPAPWPPTSPKRILLSTYTSLGSGFIYIGKCSLPYTLPRGLQNEQIWGTNLCWNLSSLWIRWSTDSSLGCSSCESSYNLSFYLHRIKWVNWPVFQFCLMNYVKRVSVLTNCVETCFFITSQTEKNLKDIVKRDTKLSFVLCNLNLKKLINGF